MILSVKSKINPFHFGSRNEEDIPKKFPAIDKDGVVWVSEEKYLVHSATIAFDDKRMSEASEEEQEIFWRYYKIWKLMNE